MFKVVYSDGRLVSQVCDFIVNFLYFNLYFSVICYIIVCYMDKVFKFFQVIYEVCKIEGIKEIFFSFFYQYIFWIWKGNKIEVFFLNFYFCFGSKSYFFNYVEYVVNQKVKLILYDEMCCNFIGV